MGLGGFISDGLDSLGLNGSEVKPINQGEAVTVVEHQGMPVNSVWDFLDNIGDTVQNGVGEYVAGKVQSEVDRIQTGSESTVDSTGDPYDQAGQPYVNNKNNQGFAQRYQMPLLVGAGFLGLALVISLGRR